MRAPQGRSNLKGIASPAFCGPAAARNDIEEETKTLLKYFFIGLALPNDTFWVNLRPDSPDNIIDDQLARTDIGRILLEADVQLKKDTAQATSPQTPEGKVYWDKLYKKAGELFGEESITIPTLTRPWIVPDEVIIRETAGEAGDTAQSPSAPFAYIYKATLKVLLEEDYLKSTENRAQSTEYSFKDPRLKELNKYSSQLIRELIIPKLIKEVNTSKRYANLRQVYYSLILASWFKARNQGKDNPYARLIDQRDLTNLTSQEPTPAPYGQTIRSYFSGGITGIATAIPKAGELTFIDRQTGARVTVLQAVERISTAHNPYLLAADILEVDPSQRGVVLENLVVRLADKKLASEEVEARVAKIDAAHKIEPGKLGPRNPDGTYTSTHTPEEIQRKAKEMRSGFTLEQRRNLMEYGLAGEKREATKGSVDVVPELQGAEKIAYKQLPVWGRNLCNLQSVQSGDGPKGNLGTESGIWGRESGNLGTVLKVTG